MKTGPRPPLIRDDVGRIAARDDCVAVARMADREGQVFQSGSLGAVQKFASPSGLADVEVGAGCRVAALDNQYQVWTYRDGQAMLLGSAKTEAVGAYGEPRLAEFADGWLVGLPGTGEVKLVGPSGTSVWHRSDRPGWPADIASTIDGTVYTLDRQLGRVELWQVDTVSRTWPVGITSPAMMLAAGRDASSESILAVLTEDKRVEVYRPDGQLVDDFDASLGGQFAASGLGASDGLILVYSNASQALAVFRDQGPEAVVTPSPAPPPADGTCRMRGSGSVDPESIVLGQTSTLQLALSVDCPEQRRAVGADVVIAIDVNAGVEKARHLAKVVVAALNPDRDRIAVVVYNSLAGVANRRLINDAFTDDVARIVADIDAIVHQGGIESRVDNALSLASRLFEEAGRADAVSTFVLISDGNELVAAGHPGNPPRKEQAILLAKELRERGVLVYCIGIEPHRSNTERDYLIQIAGSPGRYLPSDQLDVAGMLGRTIGREVRYAISGRTVAEHRFDGRVDYVPGSAGQRAIEAQRRLLWSVDIMPASGLTLTYAVRPVTSGMLPVGESIEARFIGKDGPLAQVTVALPLINVVTASPSPTMTPTATSTLPPRQAIYLPLVLRQRCAAVQAGTDFVFVIDASHSMREPLADGSSRMATVKEALWQSVTGGAISMADQVAVIGFNDVAHVYRPLAPPSPDLAQVIDDIATGASSMLGDGLDAAIAELVSRRRNTDNRAVLVVLTDGRVNDLAAASERAAVAKSMSVATFVLLIGASAGSESQLQGLTSGPGFLRRADSSEAVAADLSSILRHHPCSADPTWP